MNISVLDSATLGMDLDLTPFNKYGDVTIYRETLDKDIIEHARDSEILILNKVVLGEKEFKALPSLRLICLTATGYNNIDTNKAREYKIGVCNVPDYSTDSVAQHTFSMLLFQMQHLNYYHNYINGGSYFGSSTFTHIERPWGEIKGKKWGIIGLGNIGRRVADIATVFGANVSYYSTSGVKRKENYPEVSKEQILRESDIISIHAPLNNSTRNLIGDNEFNLVKNNLIILNLGRGGIINEEALAKAIDNNKIQGACLDVFTTEPIERENPLVNLKNRDKLFMTPHLAWGSIEARNRVVTEICLNIEAFENNVSRNRV